MRPDDPIEHNRRAWDQRAREGLAFTRPATTGELENPSSVIDPWVAQEPLTGRRLLCLAGGGGRQGVLYAAAGAEVTIVDVSEQQLIRDRQVAADHGLSVRTVAASMDDLSGIEDASFDIVVQPVSTCYVPDLARAYAQVARVIRSGGLYVSQHKQPASLQADTRRSPRGYELVEPYYRSQPLPRVRGSVHREADTVEFLHRWDQLVGELCRCGFVIEDLAEPYHGDVTARPGSFEDRSLFAPPYVRIKARRAARPDAPQPTSNSLLIP